MAGINTDIYKPHSCQSASTNKARDNGVDITDILKRGCWKSQNTFTKFYSKDIINKENSGEDLDYSKLLLKKIENPQIAFIYFFIFIHTE